MDADRPFVFDPVQREEIADLQDAGRFQVQRAYSPVRGVFPDEEEDRRAIPGADQKRQLWVRDLGAEVGPACRGLPEGF